MSNGNKDIQGNASVSRNAAVGGNASVGGNLHVGHNVRVEGWLDARNIIGAMRGLFASEEALKAACPRPMPGWHALVGDGLPADVWVAVRRGDETEWEPTGKQGGNPAIATEAYEEALEGIRHELGDIRDNAATLRNDFTAKSQSMQDQLTRQEESIATLHGSIAGIAGELEEIRKSGGGTPSVKVSELDTLGTRGRTIDLLNLLKDSGHTRFAVVSDILAGVPAGVLDVFSDDSRHVVTEVLTTNYTLDGNGSLYGHSDWETHIYARGMNVNAPFSDTEKGKWSAWKDICTRSGGDTGGGSGAPTEELQRMKEDIQLLKDSLWPLDLILAATPEVIEVGTATEVSVSWDLRRQGNTVEGDFTMDWESPGTAHQLTSAKGTKKATLTPAAPCETLFKVTGSHDGTIRSATARVTAVYPTYFGKVDSSAFLDSAAVASLGKQLHATRLSSQSGIDLADERLCIAYPKSMGALTSVKDGNDLETLTAYDVTEIEIGGVEYYCYTMRKAVSASGVKQTYC